ncbi:selenocysteine-specific translation elongation factor [Desulfurobacterium thermolithotrophum]|uniref:selenocysteine-specific translation elongation factor n=1 Tax=Desulfurobacterium thermolithotrophum TaxID=64160 RepID=UPI0013D8A5A9|nr:selenocysteine-specific translation elongation factor [Desulfurobacterium thermolithotrophum]
MATDNKKFLIVGTAGHIDHGKTSLIKALTGIDTDRWEEEKKRGMTIDLGFANLQLPSGIFVGIVDVPGHEKFIKNMLAGAHGIDFVLFVVAADEGIMPQTEEHLTVCQMLGTKKGIIVLTKKDLVDEEWLELVKEELKEYFEGTFLENAPIVPVSSKTGEGIDKLISEIDKLAKETSPKIKKGILRLPVDRSFTVKGFGTVITGTLISGKVSVGDNVEILPQKKQVKVRGVQVHGKSVSEAFAGQRTALNLSDVSKEEVERGNVIATPSFLRPTDKVDVELILSKNADVIIQSGHKVHFHHLTKDVEGEVYLIDKDELLPGDKCFAQIRLKEEIIPVFEDRFVIRNYSPARVIGGGEILNPLPERKFRKRFKKEWLEDLKTFKGKEKEKILCYYVEKFPGKFSKKDFVQLINLSPDEVEKLVEYVISKKSLLSFGGKLYSTKYVEELKGKVISTIEKYHREYPISEGMNKESLRTSLKIPTELLSQVIKGLVEMKKLEDAEGIVKISGFVPKAEGTRFEKIIEKVENTLKSSNFAPPDLKELLSNLSIQEEDLNLVVNYLVNRKNYEKIGDFLYHPESMKKIREILKNHFMKKESLSVGEFKDYLGISRKYAIPLLEYFDRTGELVRKGNERIKGNLK